ncbi:MULTISPECIES: polymer-forming cytoskeletal protein [unclassified Paenibacillus]|uniref:bactofilin family protein n=1 Tax=unclassified Paenibacillus TaxID=185978 RepID=UPI001AE54C14|nr:MULTISPECIES: polymer-forming cytoskeletal protein [unclassified Paenibacillus]MBP1153831.1 cytoskeletal protein CcmA (bactofilin family) [Paenibacillus sp. PvP091]MBP1170784.1 cytoskeletal protein CcmA (bactofilin family) [Paenibacillus sp. PvR098]MBP2441812.1 cytoskeletal protein CcmA (bactofilin family) [Paenibacillus sp. PvP052]
MIRLSRKGCVPSKSHGAVSLIGAGSVFEGVLRTEADLRIEGAFKGVLQTSGEVAIGEEGCVRSTELRARDVIIAGHLEGRVQADGFVRITSTETLIGTVRAASLMIEQGAIFQGQSEMCESHPLQEEVTIAIAML